MTKFLLDSGDLQEYKEIIKLAKSQNSEIWGATTNPSLIAKTLKGRKISEKEAFELQKEIVMEILSIVPGAVSAEVYADEKTTADQMFEQGLDIAGWDKRVYVKLPTTLEGLKARTKLREKNIPINNTLVFSQEQIFAINLHEKIVRQKNPKISNKWPPFISPFIGRLDDKGENGMSLIENGMKINNFLTSDPLGRLTWILAASIRSANHIKHCLELNTDLITAPASAFRDWFMMPSDEKNKLNPIQSEKDLTDIPIWNPPESLMKIETTDEFVKAIESGDLNISHPLTDVGIKRFAQDWKSIISA